jgi:hypothetical protein
VHDFGGLVVAFLAGFSVAVGAGNLLAVAQAAADLLIEHFGDFQHEFSDAIGNIGGGEALFAKIAGEDQLSESLDRLDDGFFAGKINAVEVGESGLAAEAADEAFDNAWELFIELLVSHN